MQTKNIISLFLVIAIFIVIAFCCCRRPDDLVTKIDNKTSVNGNNNQSKTASSSPNVSTNSTPLLPLDLSAKEKLEAGKKALEQEDLSTARNYLSAIPKGSPEYAAAEQLIAKLELREQRKKIQDQLADIKRQEANQEELMNKTEKMLDGEGTIGKQIYLNALKRKAELQLQRIELERKLKKLPL